MKTTAEVSGRQLPPDHGPKVDQRNSRQFRSFLKGKHLGVQPREELPAWLQPQHGAAMEETLRPGQGRAGPWPQQDGTCELRAPTRVSRGRLHTLNPLCGPHVLFKIPGRQGPPYRGSGMNSSFTRPTRFILAQNFISADPFRNTCGMSGWGTWALLTPASEKVYKPPHWRLSVLGS